MLAAGLAWLLGGASSAQPLQSGVQVSDGTRYLVEDDTLRTMVGGQDLSKVDGRPKVRQVYQGGQGWEEAFLALTPTGLSRVTFWPNRLHFEKVGDGNDLVVVPWGEDFLVASVAENRLLVVSPDTVHDFSFWADVAPGTARGQSWAIARMLALSSGNPHLLPGQLDSVMVLDNGNALVKSDQGYFLLKQGDAPTLLSLSLPFPADKAVLTTGRSRSLIWSPDSSQALDLDRDDILTFPFAPEFGVRVLAGGEILLANSKSLAVLSNDSTEHRFAAPPGLDAIAFVDWSVVLDNNILRIAFDEESQTKTRSYDLGAAATVQTTDLGEGEVHKLFTPTPGTPGRPLLFVDTHQEEPKIDEKGKPVTNLETRKPDTLKVRGHRIYALDEQGHWAVIVDEPRAALVGPIEQVGDRVVYATQTEPEHQAGQKLALNRLYPYPAVIVTGRSMSEPKEAWTFQGERGETPSKGRLPESAWPLLPNGGPLLVTSEDNRLLALDPASGKLRWASPKLPMDDSSPLILNWTGQSDQPAQLGLVASKGTGKALLLIDPSSGQLVDNLTLSAAFFWDKWRHLLGVLIVCAALAYYIYAAGKRDLFIRKIAGLRALDEAVGRATEMGKPVLYVVGLADVDDIQTMASLSILSHVARKTAEYDTPIITTTPRAVVYSTAHEIVRDAFSVAGRPDAFSSDSVRYISDDQFGYTAGVDGIMVREKPAANFYIGNFYAESLILAETGFATGSIQIAGTAQPSQIPFFVAACDYTLIGEELYAASAYLSQDPLQVGSLRGQDVGKMIVMILLVVCSILVSMGIDMQAVSQWMGVDLV